MTLLLWDLHEIQESLVPFYSQATNSSLLLQKKPVALAKPGVRYKF